MAVALSACYFPDWATNKLLLACCKLNLATPRRSPASLRFYLSLETKELAL